MMFNNDIELRVLIVDDSELTRNTIAKILEDEGYKVVGRAPSVADAIKMIHSTECNLIISDVVMPERSGLELAKIVQESYGGIQMIMMSSLKMENIILEAISYGALDFIDKPFKREDLLSAVEKINANLKKMV